MTRGPAHESNRYDDWDSDDVTPPHGSAWDLVVIGGGTAGLVAAKTAAGFGATVLMVERDRIGGDCLWTGCVPSKALLAAARAAADAKASARLGIRVGELRVDFPAVMAHVHAAIGLIEPADSPAAMRAARVRIAHASARFAGRDAVTIAGRTVRFRQALVATGAAPVIPPIDGLAEAHPHTSETIFSSHELPRCLLVLGGGSVGCELGQAFARLGSQVTIIESGPRLLPGEDEDAAELVHAALSADGVDIRTGTAVSRVARNAAEGAPWRAEVDADSDADGGRGGDAVGFDVVLVAVGRAPRTADLGLDVAGVAVDERGFVLVDRHLRTTNPRIWAAGDLTGYPQFTHTAGVHGTLVASNAILGLRRRVDVATNPRVTFTQPEIAAFGVNLTQAQRDGHTVRCVAHGEVDRAIAEADTAGFSRLILDGKGRLVGAMIVGPRAGESLPELVLAARHGLRARDIAGVIHAYPTYSDGVWNAAIVDVRAGLQRPMLARATSGLATIRRWRMSLRARRPGRPR